MILVFIFLALVQLARGDQPATRAPVVNHEQIFSTSNDLTRPESSEIHRHRRNADAKDCFSTTFDYAYGPFSINLTSTLIKEINNFGEVTTVFHVNELPSSPQPPQPKGTVTATVSDYDSDYNFPRFDNHDFPAEICSERVISGKGTYYCGTQSCSIVTRTSTISTPTKFVVVTATLRPCGACSIRVKINPPSWEQKARCVWSRSACTFNRPARGHQEGSRRRQGGYRRRTRAIMTTVSKTLRI